MDRRAEIKEGVPAELGGVAGGFLFWAEVPYENGGGELLWGDMVLQGVLGNDGWYTKNLIDDENYFSV